MEGSHITSRNGARAEIADEVILDGRLALFHHGQRWLAIADLHFGFEISQRAAGNLFPLWGMRTIQSRVTELIEEYQPEDLLLVGDLIHDRTAVPAFLDWIKTVTDSTNVVLISGNHDRQLRKQANMLTSWRLDGFLFHHGHCEIEPGEEIQVIGHHHPAHVVRDGAGLRLKLPAFVQQDHCWIMPAFSQWAAGTPWPQDEGNRIWLCSPNRIMCL